MGNPVNRVLFVNSEIMPFLPETPVSKIGRYLPQGIQDKKKQIRAFMPRYGCINERKNQLHEVIRLSGMNIIIGDVDRTLVIKVASIAAARIQVYFIDNDDFFRRKQDRFRPGREILRGQRPEGHFLREGRSGDGQEIALGPGCHPLSGMDIPPCPALPQESLLRGSHIRRKQSRHLPIQRHHRPKSSPRRSRTLSRSEASSPPTCPFWSPPLA